MKGHAVLRETVEAWSLPDALQALADGPYLICKTPTCPVAYFTSSGRVVTQRDLHSRVGLKQGAGVTPVCYCFGHTVEAIESELRVTGRTNVVELITAEIKAGTCACETKNPEGRCCLGDVRAAVQAIRDKLAVHSSENPEAPVACTPHGCAP